MKKIISILLAAVMVMALLAGCGSKNKDHTNDNNTPNNNQTTELSGSVATNGSTSMDKVIGALREQFMTDHKNVTVTYDPTGSGSGIEAVKNGTADIGRRKPSVSAAGSLHNGLRHIVCAESAQTRPQFGKEINYVLHEHKDTISLRIPHVFPEVVLFL